MPSSLGARAHSRCGPESGFVQFAAFSYIAGHMRTTPLVDWGRNPFEPAGCSPPTLVAAKSAAAPRGPLRQLCPARPGIYGMLDQDGQLIYVGKAKNLRRRLLGYLRRRGRDRKA